jgi:hypothetical protein
MASKRRTNLILTGALLFACWYPGARAQEVTPTHLEAAAAVVQLYAQGDSMAKAMNLVMGQMVQGIAAARPDVAPERLAAFGQALGKLMEARMPELMQGLAKAYAQRLSEADLVTLAAFLRSEVGQRFIAAVPELTQDGIQIGQEWSRRNLADIEAIAADILGK